MVKFIGTSQDDVFEGGDGDDTFVLWYGNDVADGGGGGDNFIFDGRWISDGEFFRIRDLDFSEGDTLTFRLFDPGTFSDTVDPDNDLQILGTSLNGAIFDSFDDIVEAHNSGALVASKGTDISTVLTFNVNGNDVSIRLNGVDFDSLGILSPDLAAGDDLVVGTGFDDDMRGWGGNDELLMRFGSDTAIGGNDADAFIFDGRFVNNGDSHTVRDLDFGQGDTLVFRFMDAGSFDDSKDPANDFAVSNGGSDATFDSVEDIQEAVANGVMSGADDGSGGTTLTIAVGGDTLNVTLDGWDIF